MNFCFINPINDHGGRITQLEGYSIFNALSTAQAGFSFFFISSSTSLLEIVCLFITITLTFKKALCNTLRLETKLPWGADNLAGRQTITTQCNKCHQYKLV